MSEEGSAIRRRRSCPQCAYRFTTYERLEEVPLHVLKRSGGKEPFDRAKMIAGIQAGGAVRPPMLELTDAEKETVRRAFDSCGLKSSSVRSSAA